MSVLTAQSLRMNVFRGAVCRSWVWPGLNKTQQFVHKKPCVSRSARQSQIVADKINTASRYE